MLRLSLLKTLKSSPKLYRNVSPGMFRRSFPIFRKQILTRTTSKFVVDDIVGALSASEEISDAIVKVDLSEETQIITTETPPKEEIHPTEETKETPPKEETKDSTTTPLKEETKDRIETNQVEQIGILLFLCYIFSGVFMLMIFVGFVLMLTNIFRDTYYDWKYRSQLTDSPVKYGNISDLD